MKNITILDRISNLIENIDYKRAYIEIETKDDKFIIEKDKKSQIGFRKDSI